MTGNKIFTFSTLKKYWIFKTFSKLVIKKFKTILNSYIQNIFKPSKLWRNENKFDLLEYQTCLN